MNRLIAIMAVCAAHSLSGCTHDAAGNLVLTPAGETGIEEGAEVLCDTFSVIFAGGSFASVCPGAETLMGDLLDPHTDHDDAGAPAAAVAFALATDAGAPPMAAPRPSLETHAPVFVRMKGNRRKRHLLGYVPKERRREIQARADKLPDSRLPF